MCVSFWCIITMFLMKMLKAIALEETFRFEEERI